MKTRLKIKEGEGESATDTVARFYSNEFRRSSLNQCRDDERRDSERAAAETGKDDDELQRPAGHARVVSWGSRSRHAI